MTVGTSIAVPEGTFDCKTEPTQAFRSSEIRFWSFARPHMRTFHLSYMALFLAFVNWFCLPPLLITIKAELKPSEKQLQIANIASVCMTIFMRVIIGKLCDKFGARRTMAVLLSVSCIPVFAVTTIHDANSYIVVRCFIGIIGGVFGTYTGEMRVGIALTCLALLLQ
jgi:NNP family nitrate/nitrite transporter-like MFS transporter